MKKDLKSSISQIKQKLADFEKFEKNRQFLSEFQYKSRKERLDRDFETFLKEIRRFSNQYDENLKYVMNRFLLYSKNLDKNTDALC